MVGRVAERAPFFEQPARAEPELQAAVREHVQRRGLLRERERVRDDERHDSDTEPYALRRCGREGKRGHSVRPRGRRVPRRQTRLAIRIAWRERCRDDGVGIRPEGIEAQSLGSLRDGEH